jgi:hypothetical protein
MTVKTKKHQVAVEVPPPVLKRWEALRARRRDGNGRVPSGASLLLEAMLALLEREGA